MEYVGKAGGIQVHQPTVWFGVLPTDWSFEMSDMPAILSLWPPSSTASSDRPNPCSEQRVTDPVTGGQKGQKAEQYSLIPPEPLADIARVYGMGAVKYEPFNWMRGYKWSLSYDALYRHIEATRRGEWIDSESGLPHLAHAAFHLFTLMEFERKKLGTDDRGFKDE